LAQLSQLIKNHENISNTTYITLVVATNDALGQPKGVRRVCMLSKQLKNNCKVTVTIYIDKGKGNC
jgi:hypothetical protein